jgi:AcrR family transcriptional regulator
MDNLHGGAGTTMQQAMTDQERRLEVGRVRRLKTRAKIVAAAFDLFGEESGLYARIEEIAKRAEITRATFYDHFTGMAELREAVTFEVTHDFLTSVTHTVSRLSDPREQAAAAIRFYLEKVREDARWGWSMINLSANGVIFGAETFRQAELTVVAGMEAGLLTVPLSAIGRDTILGTTIAAISSMLREQHGADYPALIVQSILMGMGVDATDAREIANRPLPRLISAATP